MCAKKISNDKSGQRMTELKSVGGFYLLDIFLFGSGASDLWITSGK
jgi:hypothetical protein